MELQTRDGFGLVEVIVSMTIMAVALLSLAQATTHYFTATRVTDVRTERVVLLQQTVEELKATPFDSLKAKPMSSPDTVGTYRVWWDMTSPTRDLRVFTIISIGPGYVPTYGWQPAVRDTMQQSIARTW
jgi:prepilin-type N-terminal cleavage/methylation domain-containing protein